MMSYSEDEGENVTALEQRRTRKRKRERKRRSQLHGKFEHLRFLLNKDAKVDQAGLLHEAANTIVSLRKELEDLHVMAHQLVEYCMRKDNNGGAEALVASLTSAHEITKSAALGDARQVASEASRPAVLESNQGSFGAGALTERDGPSELADADESLASDSLESQKACDKADDADPIANDPASCFTAAITAQLSQLSSLGNTQNPL